MKALKVSAQLLAELTAIVGQLTAESGKIKTYDNAVETLIHQSVVIPPEVLQGIEDFIKKNKQFGYLTKEEFLRGAARWLMDQLNIIDESPALTRANYPSISSSGGEQQR